MAACDAVAEAIAGAVGGGRTCADGKQGAEAGKAYAGDALEVTSGAGAATPGGGGGGGITLLGTC
eukprot:15478320-Alexandrium_andersonii.AAC.1